MDEVWGAASDPVDFGGGMLIQAERWVVVPPNALAAVTEGFCPACLIPLGGNPGNWCPSCKVFWHIRHA